MARREYTGGSTVTTLSGGLSAGATTINITDGTAWPTGAGGPFSVDIDFDNSKYEKILVTSRSGNVLTLASAADRGYDDTTDTSHDTGATIRHVATSIDFDEANAHTNNVGTIKHTQAALAADSVGSSQLIAGSVGTSELAAGSVTNDELTGSGLDISKFTVGETTQGAGYLVQNANVKPQTVQGTGGLTRLTGTIVDIPGLSITVTTPRANMLYVVHANLDVIITRQTDDGNAICVGVLDVDGAGQSQQLLYQAAVTTLGSHRATVSQTWTVALATAASHTFKMRASKTDFTSNPHVDVGGVHSTLSILHGYG